MSATILGTACFLLVDLLIIGRRPHEPSMREVTWHLAGYVSLAVVFGLGVLAFAGPRYPGVPCRLVKWTMPGLDRWSVRMTRLHHDEIDVDEVLVRQLLASLPAKYQTRPLQRFGYSGSTNALFRLGDDLLVRVPRQPGGTATIKKEQRWLPYVARSLPVAVPEVVVVGEPVAGYPEKWAIVRYLEGDAATLPTTETAPRHELARDIAGVVTALRALPVPQEALVDSELRWYRGEPLARYDRVFRAGVEASRSIQGLDLDLDTVAEIWRSIVDLPAANTEVEPSWFHGDLLAENLLVRSGRLRAVLDFGGLAVGNPAVDLCVAWEVLDPASRTTFRAALGVTDDEWRVARGWALALGVMAFPYYWRSMPDRCAQRLFMAQQVVADVGREP